MRKLATAAFCLTVVFALGCGSKPSAPTPDSKQSTPTPGAATTLKPKDLIVGKWEAVEPKWAAMRALMFEFRANGTVVKSMKTELAPFPLIASGKYKFPAEDVIQIELDPPPKLLVEKAAKPEHQKAKVAVTNAELTLTPEDDKQEVIKLKRKP